MPIAIYFYTTSAHISKTINIITLTGLRHKIERGFIVHVINSDVWHNRINWNSSTSPSPIYIYDFKGIYRYSEVHNFFYNRVKLIQNDRSHWVSVPSARTRPLLLNWTLLPRTCFDFSRHKTRRTDEVNHLDWCGGPPAPFPAGNWSILRLSLISLVVPLLSARCDYNFTIKKKKT